jgi:hypothetical protein
MGTNKPTSEDVIKKWKELDRKNEKPVGLNKVCAEMDTNSYYVMQLFPDGINEMKRQNGIRIARQTEPYTRDEVLEKLDHVVSQHGIPTWTQIKRGGMTEKTVKRLFHKTDDPKRDFIKSYSEWLKKNKPDSEKLPLVENWLKGEGKLNVSPVPKDVKSKRKLHVSAKSGGRIYGETLAFRNMMYEPTEEEGVVLLFGMVSGELGYTIEGAWQSFPDCVAKRIVSSKGRKEPVRIEFQYKSRDFLTDGHDPNGCDVIVCWEDNWGKDCPLEVLELRQAIKELPNPKK